MGKCSRLRTTGTKAEENSSALRGSLTFITGLDDQASYLSIRELWEEKSYLDRVSVVSAGTRKRDQPRVGSAVRRGGSTTGTRSKCSEKIAVPLKTSHDANISPATSNPTELS
jgi:hypothetical protein